MKHRLKQDLPFMKAGTVFQRAASLACGDGWAIPAKPKKQGQTADNPVTVFASHENELLTDIITDKEWVEPIPETASEKLDLYESRIWSREKYLQEQEQDDE